VPLAAEFLEILRCPKCLGVLAEDKTNGLACAACRVVYPVDDGIPNFVDEAKPLAHG
jgi:uncharacterized protein YbaR (Trm112 family)